MKTFIRTLALAATAAGFAASVHAGAFLSFDDKNDPIPSSSGVSSVGGNYLANPFVTPVVNESPGTYSNFDGQSAAAGFVLDIDSGDYNQLSFKYLISDFQINFTVEGTEGSKSAFVSSSSGDYIWVAIDDKNPLDFSDLGKIKSVAFSVGKTDGFYNQFALDDVSFSLKGSTTNVPEPASLALVGLALAGVAASRRRVKA